MIVNHQSENLVEEFNESEQKRWSLNYAMRWKKK